MAKQFAALEPWRSVYLSLLHTTTQKPGCEGVRPIYFIAIDE